MIIIFQVIVFVILRYQCRLCFSPLHLWCDNLLRKANAPQWLINISMWVILNKIDDMSDIEQYWLRMADSWIAQRFWWCLFGTSVSGRVIATHSLGVVADAILGIFCTFIGKSNSDQIYDKLSSSVMNYEYELFSWLPLLSLTITNWPHIIAFAE